MKLCLVVVLVTFGLAACGHRSLPQEYDWDRSPNTLVASLGVAGGYVPQMYAFVQSPYGAPFVRLMGDGHLYHGDGGEVKVRELDEPAMQALLARVRPDLFDGYEANYNAAMATDMPTTTLSVAVHHHGAHEVAIYGLHGATVEERGVLPHGLVEGAEALEEEGKGGDVYRPRELRLGALAIDPQAYGTVDTAKVRDWPLPDLDLSGSRPYGEGRRVSDPTRVETIVKLFSTAQTSIDPNSSVVFRQGGAFYWVGFSVVLP